MKKETCQYCCHRQDCVSSVKACNYILFAFTNRPLQVGHLLQDYCVVVDVSFSCACKDVIIDVCCAW